MRTSVLALKDLAYSAGRNISFDPEKLGERLLNDLENGLNDFLPKIPEALQEDYERRYIEKYRQWLFAMSRTFSVMITGAGNFNRRRHEKMNRYEESARMNFEKWQENVVQRVNRQHRLVGWEEVERLEEKLVQLTEKQEFMKSVNKIVRSKLPELEQYEELEALGLSHDEISDFMTEPEYGRKGFQRFELSNNLAKIKDTEAAIKRHKSMAEKEDKEYNYNGFKVSVCYSEERIRFYFDDILDNDKKMLLKKSAFKWSPKNGAWQRQLTSNATIATKRLIKQFNNE